MLKSRPYVYLIGSLGNPNVPAVGNRLRAAGFDVFDDWHAAGPEADKEWQRYETQRGRDLGQALNGEAAWHTFLYDWSHLNRAKAGVLISPAGKSGHLELGYLVGKGRPCYILYPAAEPPDKWDVMYRFAQLTTSHLTSLIIQMQSDAGKGLM